MSLAATASDDVGVTAVEFFRDGSTSLGVDTTAPYLREWDSTTASNGSHVLTAVARDAAGNQTTSTGVPVTTTNPGFVNEVVVPGITAATTMAFLPDGRMLVGELTETIWVVQPGASQPDPTPFLQLDGSRLIGEQGLLDILVDPNFAQNGYYYVFYTRATSSGNHNRVSRFTASGNATVPGSEVALWEDPDDAGEGHLGGSLAFGTDGKLYISTGENWTPADAQRLDIPRGKILRINKDGTIPTDNPFYDGAGPNRDEIWAYGLRNPFRMSIDPVTGRMYIGDVGSDDRSIAIRGAQRRRPRRELRLAGLRGTVRRLGNDEPDLLVPARRTRCVRHRRRRLSREPVPERVLRELLLRRLRPALGSPSQARRERQRLAGHELLAVRRKPGQPRRGRSGQVRRGA